MTPDEHTRMQELEGQVKRYRSQIAKRNERLVRLHAEWVQLAASHDTVVALEPMWSAMAGGSVASDVFLRCARSLRHALPTVAGWRDVAILGGDLSL